MTDGSARSDAALRGLRVLDLAGARAAYCGKLFADLGADVIKIEPPGGDPARGRAPFLDDRAGPDRSLFFLYMNTGRRSVVLDLDRPEGVQQLKGLAAGADLVIETGAPGALEVRGLGYAALAEANPSIVLTSITGFGQTGPYRQYRSSDLVANAMGGAMVVIGDEADPPVRLAGAQAEIVSSTCAAAASMIALHHSRRSGRGQHVDISMQEVMTSVSHIAGVGKWLDDGIIPKRLGTGLTASVPSGAYPCQDGIVYLMVNRPAHWKALAEWIHEVTGNQEVLDPMFEGPSAVRLEYRELLDLFISELTSRFTVDAVYHEGQRRHIAFTPANTALSLGRDEHLRAREYFVNVEGPDARPLRIPGAPYRHSLTPWRIARPAPRLGEHTATWQGERRERPRKAENREVSTSAALEGLRVVEFGTGMAGPWVGRFMAWSGAEVIKVESAKHPDVCRLYIAPHERELGIQPQLSPWFTDWNAGKRFIALDLAKPEAIDLCRQVIAKSDIVVANYSTGVLEKLGLGYADLQADNPGLVMLSSSGYGDTGPHNRYVTWGSNIEALSGLSRLSGFPHRDCTVTHFAYPDPLSALHGIFAVLSAIEYRERTGKGQYINMSQFETTLASVGHVVLEQLANGREPRKLGNGSLWAAPHGVYPCAGDDRWCAISVASDADWERFCDVLGRPQWAEERRFASRAARLDHSDELDRFVAEWTADQTDYEVMEILQRAGIAAGVAQNTEDLFQRDPQLAARNFFEEIPHFKKGTVTATGIPLGLTGTPGRTAHAGEAIGQDNEYVFRDLLGLSEDQLREQIAIGAVETTGLLPVK